MTALATACASGRAPAGTDPAVDTVQRLGGRSPLRMLRRTAATAQAQAHQQPPLANRAATVQREAGAHSGCRPTGGAGAASRRSLCVRPPAPPQRALHRDPRAAARPPSAKGLARRRASTPVERRRYWINGGSLAQLRSSLQSPILDDGAPATVDDTVVDDTPWRGWGRLGWEGAVRTIGRQAAQTVARIPSGTDLPTYIAACGEPTASSAAENPIIHPQTPWRR